MFLNKEEVYSFNEGLKIIGLSKTERICYEFSKELNTKGIYLKEEDKIYNTLACTLGFFMYAEKVIAAPSTGIPKLDQGGWKLVGVAQSVIFWTSMFYTFRSLLELTIKGEGSWKKVGTGFVICAMDYLIPWGFQIIRGIFL